MTYPMPANEVARLKAIVALGLLERPVPSAWQRICRAARARFHVPFAAVTILSGTTQHIQARCGFDTAETDRGSAFCNWTVMHDEVFVVPDALAHSGLRDNPFVTGEPKVRFYAGAPLSLGDGLRVGAFCILDTAPRSFTPEDARILKHLARMVVDEIWLENLEGCADLDPGVALHTPFDLRVTARQIRGARGILGWSVDQLAGRAGVSPATVKRAELPDGKVGEDYLKRIAASLEEAGVEFLFLPDGEPGVRPHRL